MSAKGSGTKPSAAAPPTRSPPALPRGNSLARILVAEDNLTNQEVAMAMLNKTRRSMPIWSPMAWRPSKRSASSSYDAVLMDCEMPEMDGYEATRRIRERRTGMRNPHIPIIALTVKAVYPPCPDAQAWRRFVRRARAWRIHCS